MVFSKRQKKCKYKDVGISEGDFPYPLQELFLPNNEKVFLLSLSGAFLLCHCEGTPPSVIESERRERSNLILSNPNQKSSK
ncbi:MAG TPA: hypothetical protein PKJ95_04980 [Atribacterota bacterium]|nr:hypothetical protein [Atribacterota bacterium]